MSIRGKFKFSANGTSMPITNPPIPKNTLPAFTNTSCLEFRYKSNAEEVVKIIPDIFEIDENPEVIVRTFNFGLSRVGNYREIIFYVVVYLQGKTYEYVPYIYASNDAVLISGREPLGMPKLIANIEFNPLKESNTPLVTTKLSRPAEVTLAHGVFRPSGYLGQIEDKPELYDQGRITGLRSLPGRPPIAEVCSSQIHFTSGDVWFGDGCMAYTAFSYIDDIHKMPVVEPMKAKLIVNGSGIIKDSKFIDVSEL